MPIITKADLAEEHRLMCRRTSWAPQVHPSSQPLQVHILPDDPMTQLELPSAAPGPMSLTFAPVAAVLKRTVRELDALRSEEASVSGDGSPR